MMKTALREKGLMLLDINGAAQCGVKPWQQECEAAGHVASAVRQQGKENAGTRLFSIFICSRASASGTALPTFGWVFPHLFTQSRKSLTDMSNNLSPK